MNTEIPPVATFGIAVVGAVLGVINTYQAFEQRRVKLLVRPSYGIPVPVGELMIAVEVLNLSSFPVTIAEIGFVLSGGKRYFQPELLTEQKSLPVRLGSRESITGYFTISKLDVRQIRKAFACTACGEKAFGDSPALRQIRAGEYPRG